MSAFMMTLAVGLVRWWVRLYTSGLPSGAREARGAEIDSDLWEQGQDDIATGCRPDEAALQVFGRLLLGMPADLSWRLEQAGATRREGKVSERRLNVNESKGQMAFIGVAAVMAAFTILVGVLVSFGMGES